MDGAAEAAEATRTRTQKRMQLGPSYLRIVCICCTDYAAYAVTIYTHKHTQHTHAAVQLVGPPGTVAADRVGAVCSSYLDPHRVHESCG